MTTKSITKKMTTLYLIEGPVGAGKSTHVAKLSAELGAAKLNLDEWMVTLFRPDRPEEDFMVWYAERKQRCIEQIWNVACDLLDAGIPTILEMGLIQRRDRDAFYARVDAMDYALEVQVVDAPIDVRWQRVQARNESQTGTFRMAVSKDIFDMSSRMWEPPEDAEIAERDIRFIGSA